MTTSLIPPAPPDSPRARRFGWVGWISVVVLIACLCVLCVLWEVGPEAAPSRVPTQPSNAPTDVGPYVPPSPVDTTDPNAPLQPLASVFPACMLYDDFLDVEPGKVVPMEVRVVAAPCGSAKVRDEEQAINAVAPGQISKQDVNVGSKVKVALSAPLSDVSVGPVADGDDVQTIGDKTSGQWQWRLRPNTSGDFTLPLSLTIYDSTGEHDLHVGKILNLHMHVPVTISYIASSMWTAFAAFLTSLQGVVASIAGAAAGSAGFRAWIVRKSKKAANVVAAAPTISSSGYL